ncbi:hypothetical protein [Mobiluncus sp.]|uniref:hypothetical protein n=1 Tax=Mobiluncus sp. TaxID=47293 RepID=UPI0025E783C1|nr:hypothetical protein [Mobiluncus sp.]MDY6076802.1 hypothetical protein [Mobiluncus sp.]
MSNPYQPQQSNPGQVPGPQPGQPMGQPMGQQMPGQPMPGQFARPYEHPQEQTVMVLAIIGIFFWLCSPIAWYLGSKAKNEMVAQNMEPTSRLRTWTTVAMVITILGLIGIGITIILTVVGGLAFMGAVASESSAGLLPALSAI